MNEAESTITVITIVLILVSIFIATITGVVQQNQREREEQEKEEKRLSEIKCKVCSSSSMGNFICENCNRKKTAIKKEIQQKFKKSYLDLHSYQTKLMKSILNCADDFKKEYDKLQLLNVDDILNEKYSENKNTGKNFVNDMSVETEKNILIKKYNLENTQFKENKDISDNDNRPDEQYNGDYRTMFTKPYRCKDGDYVRSKAEREIDDFLYTNRIWHVYEQEYTHPVTGKTAETDFYLPDYNLYIEYFGMSDPEYVAKRDKKIEMYNSDPNIHFEYLTYKDDFNIYDKLKKILNKYGVKTM